MGDNSPRAPAAERDVDVHPETTAIPQRVNSTVEKLVGRIACLWSPTCMLGRKQGLHISISARLENNSLARLIETFAEPCSSAFHFNDIAGDAIVQKI